MTAKEQADGLILEMEYIIENNGLYALYDYDCYKSTAVKCALLLTSQMIETLLEDINPVVNFWLEVKAELEKNE